MVSKLAEEDIEALIEDGCTVHPSDVVRLNALALTQSRALWWCAFLAAYDSVGHLLGQLDGNIQSR